MVAVSGVGDMFGFDGPDGVVSFAVVLKLSVNAGAFMLASLRAVTAPFGILSV